MQIVTSTLDVSDTMKTLEPSTQGIIHFTHDFNKKKDNYKPPAFLRLDIFPTAVCFFPSEPAVV